MAGFKVALVGCGGMSNAWLSNVTKREDCEVVALVDILPESAERQKAKYGLGCGVYTDLRKAIEERAVDTVLDVTIPDSHREVVTTALRCGCRVFGEKPMASSMAAAEEIHAVARETGNHYAVMQNRRFDRRIRTLAQTVASKAIGDLGFASADFFIGAHFGGFRDMMDNPLVLDMAVHTFDQARLITGADAVAVYCHEFNPPGSWYKGNASAVCVFEMSDGSVFDYRGSWCSEGFFTSWESQWRVVGSEGTAIWDGHGAPVYERVRPSAEARFNNEFDKVTPEMRDWGRQMHDGCIDEMFASALEGRRAETDCTDNIRTMAMVFGAIESARLKRRVELGRY